MPNADEDALRAIRAASTALQERWPEGESPRSWEGVEWSGDRVQELDLRESGLEDDMLEIGLSITISNRSNDEGSVKADLMFELNDEEEIKTLAVYSLNTLDAPSSLVFSFPIGSKHVPRVLWVTPRSLDETVLAGVLGDKPGDVWISNAFFHLKQTALWEFGDTGFEGVRHSINWDDAHGIIQRNRELVLPGVDRT